MDQASPHLFLHTASDQKINGGKAWEGDQVDICFRRCDIIFFSCTGSDHSGQLRGLGNSVTMFMRQYYENVGSKKQPKLRNQPSTSSNELEDRDSGFQVIVVSLCPSSAYILSI